MARLKRYAMPAFWPVRKKERKWVVSPIAGPHRKQLCIPLQIIVKDILGLAETAGEAKKIIKAGKVLVDKKIRKELGFPVGLMDVVEIPEIKKHCRVLVNKDGLFLAEIKQSDSDKKICRIENKSVLKKGVQQLHLHDGRNVLLAENIAYRPGDSVLIHLPDQKIEAHYKLEKGSRVILINGKNKGIGGEIKDIRNRKTMLEKSTVLVKSDAKEIETLKEYIMVTSTEKGK